MKVYRNPPEKKRFSEVTQKIIFDDGIRIPFPYTLEEAIKKAFTMRNPEYLNICNRRRLRMDERPSGHIVTKKKKDGRWTSWKVQEWLFYWEYDGSDLVLPRGSFKVIKNLFNRHGKKYKLINNRYLLGKTDFRFHGKLKKKKGQLKFLDYSAKNGILQAGTGTGKTVMSLFYAVKIQQPTLIVVDTNELLEQWKARINLFYKIPIDEIGHIGGGLESIKPITVALVQTLRDRPKLLKYFGFLIVDECHVSTTQSYGRVINKFQGMYVMGLSSTPRRKDGFTRVMFWLLGQVIIQITKEDVEQLEAFGTFVNTGYEGEICFRKSYSKALAEMVRDKKRNQLIIKTIISNIDVFGIHLIISSSSKHLERLISLMPHHFQLISRLLVGKIKKEDRKIIVQDALNNKLKFLFATDKLIGKGFDEELLSVLHLTAPIADPDRIEQACGRVTRVPENEKIYKLKEFAKIFYYYDSKEVTLRGAASTASKKFKELGIKRKVHKFS